MHFKGYLDKSKTSCVSELDRLYKTSDVLILPSKCEGFVIVALEAAAYGLPVIAYDTRGVTDAVLDGETGVLLKPGSKDEEFAEVVMSWFDRPSDYDRIVCKARKRYERAVNWQAAVATLFGEIESRFFL